MHTDEHAIPSKYTVEGQTIIHRFSAPIEIYNGNLPGDDGFMGFRSDVEREYPLVQIHDFASADIRMAMSIATEVCNVTGATVDVHHRTDNHGNVDETFDEDADPTYWAPVILKAFFAPGAIEVALKVWALDAPIKLEMYFSMQMLVHRFGERVLRKGDVIRVPFNAIGNIRPKYFRIVNFTPIGNYKYVWLYAKCNCESLTGDINVLPRDMHGDQQGVALGDYNNG